MTQAKPTREKGTSKAEPATPSHPPARASHGSRPRTLVAKTAQRRARYHLLRPWPLFALLAWLCTPKPELPRSTTAEPDLLQASVMALKLRGLEADPREVQWIDAPGGSLSSRTRRPRAVVRAHHANEPADIYLITARLSPEGRLLDLTGVHNITDSSAVDERHLIVSGPRVAWIIGGAGKVYSVHYADLRGSLAPDEGGWTKTKRFQQAITNLQSTGQTQGIRRRSFRLDPAASRTVVGFSSDALLIDADSRKIRIPTEGMGKLEGERFMREQEHHLARPGNFATWAVDRVRAESWFGDERMQWVKAAGFFVLERLENAMGSVTGDDGAERVAEDLGELLDTPTATYTDPETGWPPPAMDPLLNEPLPGEGKWVPLDKDPFIRTNIGAPPPFVLSFLRPDRKHLYSRVYVTMWDPRQVALHAMSGTVEPKSATGETGPGLIPRTPQVMRRLVGAFNGGFQAMHGEFGMMADGVTYLPPKPYAATIAELRDGSTGFGTWPEDLSIPSELVSFRQNMTPLMALGAINPYKRHWWGGVPPGWEEESRTVRSGVCVTREDFVAYFYGESVDPDQLALVMNQARCHYAIHLDMNPGHTGLEFYHAEPKGELPETEAALESVWKARGKVPFMPEWEFLGRRMIKFMALMNFPRYIDREARDFFYLTLRPLIPGAAVPTAVRPAEPGEGQWTTKGLPQHGWPYAIATTTLRPEQSRPSTKVRLVKLDPKTVAAHTDHAEGDRTVVAFPNASTPGQLSAWWRPQHFAIQVGAPDKEAVLLAGGRAPGAGATAAAAIGVDGDGMLLYAEIATAPDPQDEHLLVALLASLGCDTPLILSEQLGVAIGGDRDLSGHPVAVTRRGVHLVRSEAPGARRIFQDTPIVLPKVWAPMQREKTSQ